MERIPMIATTIITSISVKPDTRIDSFFIFNIPAINEWVD